MERTYTLPNPVYTHDYYHVLPAEYKAKKFTPFSMSRSDSIRCGCCYLGMAHSQAMHDQRVQQWEANKAEAQAAGGQRWQAWQNYHDYDPGWD